MKSTDRRIQEAYEKEVSLLGVLLDCLNLERENLIHVDVKGLWSLMEEKQRILASIQDVEHEISGCGAENGEDRHAETKFRLEIRRLKKEIRARVRENVSFIRETLHFFDEIVSVIASANRGQCSYGPVLRRPFSSSVIFRSEV